MSAYPPQSAKHWVRVLKNLGFIKADRIGKGKHANKYKHPERTTSDYLKQPNFIIVPNTMYKQMSMVIIKELEYFGFSEQDIRDNC